MNIGTLALVIPGGTDNWAPQRWQERFALLSPARKVVLLPDDAINLADVRYAAVWKPQAGLLASFPNLAVIFNLGAGVDAVLADPDLPPALLVRVAIGDLTQRMTEYVVLHVLMHHRQQRYLDACQRERIWAPKTQWAAGAVRVGIMGLGVLGQDAAEVLARIGFQVAGWSRRRRTIAGIDCFAGAPEFPAFLSRTDILVCLLPLTEDTRGILSKATFNCLANDGVLGGPILINAGRGGLQVEADILAALDDGTLAAVTLDVFEAEPLPTASLLWSHPKMTISPHNAADTDPDTVSSYVIEQIERFERGLPLANVVDRGIGY